LFCFLNANQCLSIGVLSNKALFLQEIFFKGHL